VFATHLYPSAQCRAIVRHVRGEGAWEPAQVLIHSEGNLTDAVQSNAREASIASRAHASRIYDEFEEQVRRLVAPMIRSIWGTELTDCDGTQLIRYPTGGHYVPHRDADDTAYAHRYFTVLCYLNDDFVGGETSFPSLRFTATPIQGKTLVFPSRFLHSALPVVKGEKFAFLTWLCGPIPTQWL
jgi:Rps23 Pro-64 3,4-dihydroxylase Tpa1-like proline 4-hydroxylase